jgi:hypothetical protein
MPTPHPATVTSRRCASVLALALVAAWGLVVPAASATGTAGASKTCNTGNALKELAPQSSMFEAFRQAFNSDACDSIVSVLKQLSHSKKVGGRKLQENAALDEQAARQEWQAARADPEFARRLATAVQTESEPIRRELIEAALLHEYGHYRARDLQLRQISGETGAGR